MARKDEALQKIESHEKLCYISINHKIKYAT